WTVGDMVIHRPEAQLLASRLKLG
ncbi:MAG: hypothetical protein QOF58_3072, partial [Pseudonocardiales bacterium]|nr:hypothetical protein [Pseudonocardiales bacterium]